MSSTVTRVIAGGEGNCLDGSMNIFRGLDLIAVAALCTAATGYAVTPGVDPALLAKASGGDPSAEIELGDMYAAGADVPQDLKQAAEWYRKAAEQGSAAGEVYLAELYRDGRGVARDKTQAAEWYRKAAEQGEAGAQGTLAMLYVMGQGVPQSDVEAYYWLDLAAAVKSANQDQYIANRQNVGTRITVEDLLAVQMRAARWKSAHPR